MANLRALVKDWTQSASPTSGLTAYGNTGKKKTKLRAKKVERASLAPLVKKR